MLGVNNDCVIAVNMLGCNMTFSCDYDVAMLHVVIVRIILIILTWLSSSLDYALDYDISMIMPWIILSILL